MLKDKQFILSLQWKALVVETQTKFEPSRNFSGLDVVKETNQAAAKGLGFGETGR